MKIKKYLLMIFIIIFLIVIISCNYGLTDASDLIDKWNIEKENVFAENNYKFNSDGTGVSSFSEYYEDDTDKNDVKIYFTWETTDYGVNKYKLLKLKYYLKKTEDETKNLNKEYKYYYYFNYDKSYLYLWPVEQAYSTETIITYKKD